MKNAPNKPVTQSSDSCAFSEAEELGRLLGVISHEIKNPLSTIKVNLRLIDEELSASPKAGETSPIGGQTGRSEDTAEHLARARRKLAVIDKEATRLEQILDGFLRYTDRTQPHLAPLDINSLLGDMVDFFLPQALAHSITLRQSFCKEPLLCAVDADMLKQAILNLFLNAQQAIAIGGELMVRTISEGNHARIQISDTGKGITPDRIDHIFEPYQSTRPDGSGLGLATVKKIIDAHKGTITVVSQQGKGTAFTISLPLAVPEDKR
jgi:signal transduction histidine kinase